MICLTAGFPHGTRRIAANRAVQAQAAYGKAGQVAVVQPLAGQQPGQYQVEYGRLMVKAASRDAHDGHVTPVRQLEHGAREHRRAVVKRIHPARRMPWRVTSSGSTDMPPVVMIMSVSVAANRRTVSAICPASSGRKNGFAQRGTESGQLVFDDGFKPVFNQSIIDLITRDQQADLFAMIGLDTENRCLLGRQCHRPVQHLPFDHKRDGPGCRPRSDPGIRARCCAWPRT
jgi:hypothetical protein